MDSQTHSAAVSEILDELVAVGLSFGRGLIAASGAMGSNREIKCEGSDAYCGEQMD